jgi:serine/threonine protein kinase
VPVLGHRLTLPLGAGPDGASYLAEAGDGAQAEVRILSHARQDPARWERLLPRIELARLIEHGAVRRVEAVGMEGDPPAIVLAWHGPERLTDRLSKGPLPAPGVLGIGLQLVEGLAAMHRLGIWCGDLCPSRVAIGQDGRPYLDATGTRTQWPPPLEQTEADRRAAAPERETLGTDWASDVYGWGVIMASLLLGRAAHPAEIEARLLDSRTLELLRAAAAPEPEARPTAAELAERLVTPIPMTQALETRRAASFTSPPSGGFVTGPHRFPPGTQLGRYRLGERLGRGATGAVYLAHDQSDGRPVAIKLLVTEGEVHALGRFQREARMLGQVRSPYVANLIEVNADRGVHFIVTEYVEGRDLDAVLEERKKLAEPEALAVIGDVARALVDAHRRGIVHRDVKPPNILITAGPGTGGLAGRARLCDFGIAIDPAEVDRMRDGGESLVMGTPHYMAPEQVEGEEAPGPPADVYGMGATLFHLLAGRPPFDSASVVQVLWRHLSEPPPPLRQVEPGATNGAAELVARALAKRPKDRPQDAAELLSCLEVLAGRKASRIEDHPPLPPHDPSKVQVFEFKLDLESEPGELWPYVADTDRINHAIRLAPIVYSPGRDADGLPALGAQQTAAGVEMGWIEHVSEWVEGQRGTLLREFTKGRIKWCAIDIAIEARSGGGSRLCHTLKMVPSNLLGRIANAFQVGKILRKRFQETYRRVDLAIQEAKRVGSPVSPDALKRARELPLEASRKLDALLAGLEARGVSPDLARRLGDFIRLAQAHDLARIRPLALAKRLAVAPMPLLAACLHGARIGLFIPLWDLLCPDCRLPSETRESLRSLSETCRCEACAIEYPVSFDESVELIFRIHPDIRRAETRTFCISGPAKKPHVVSQLRLGAGERFAMSLRLEAGAYRVRSPQLGVSFDFRVEPRGVASVLDLPFSAGGLPPDRPRQLVTGFQGIELENRTDRPIVVLVERRASREDAVTAAMAGAHPLFRELYPEEAPPEGAALPLGRIVFLVARLAPGEDAEVDQAEAIALAHSFGGGVIHAEPGRLLAAFADALAAVRAGLAIRARWSEAVRVAVDRGPATAVRANGRLAYTGPTVDRVVELPGLLGPGQLGLGRSVAEDPELGALWRGAARNPVVLPLRGTDEWIVAVGGGA